MINSKLKSGQSGARPERPRLSLNLHTMPQTAGSHWRQWLVLGALILAVFVIIILVLYALTNR